ncbi:MAG: glutaredoxin family protein [Jaaginema sp. PMC 1079.18]|nr:glutaredoxin family protein [Jaaginema sp. PMC 1080.18]MEC4849607.1 glutaredoxin family protein [Jaaginema sp. PMC 1079.18]MEC4866219.1 glutaredoxin family protein [Jaaginema sp. PMC 1078.18]
MKLILYSKPGCHLCEGLHEKLEKIEAFDFDLEIRDITTQADWMAAYQYSIPVLMYPTPEGEQALPRFSPRASVTEMERKLQKYFGISS